MKHQQVSVDYWAIGKAMLTYGALTALVWVMLRLINGVFSLPRRLQAQQQSMEDTLKELQSRFPDLNITEEDLKNAEKEFEELTKNNNLSNLGMSMTENLENSESTEKSEKSDSTTSNTKEIEDKKTI